MIKKIFLPTECGDKDKDKESEGEHTREVADIGLISVSACSKYLLVSTLLPSVMKKSG